MSVTIKIKDLVKKYGDTTVIPELSLEIKKGEFFTLLGPSGCGKTTLLRMIAGFNSIEGGTINFNERVINQVEPGKRNIGMVFQSYAIFPHLTVKGNIAFGLENRKLSKTEINDKVEEILKVVQIEQYKDRMPKNLSGGQQQRVALARAIVIRPDVLLMDEPLSNLDAKLRVDMRNAIKDIQREVGITTVYVTHDQEEAMAVSDRIAVMKSGVIQHLGTPQEIYQRPANVFVATFIGRTNIIEGSLTRQGGSYKVNFGSGYAEELPNIQLPASTQQNELNVKISVRPEEFVMTEDQTGMKATIVHSVFLGQNTHYFVDLESGQRVEITQESKTTQILDPGQVIHLKVKKDKINVYDAAGELNYTRGGQL
ncbi:ABC transporter ATP-binding protein [Paenibacillus alvei]|uniref:ABC transporter ATP-binding protein n=1 Tax=Paenibacillus alvei TaxID=44250 RepID=A0ABT4H3Z8_PAEAL|nr:MULTISPECIES: ABC transporter ATP-binding protein [Paenibacillus]MCY7483722.1 ABC transporter ATP-binding protein [Paenibacillus alvei]MCY9539371.1 ABC transporter ATP-binding protein [Paenibacillus alvei]MCY9704795.1 ABC transporter ATP-binding protein [Paenibacillus alvei]MCY9735926.1 ABC transporter ATP-binding protein [Paenibacillus alvei]MCY9756709.1 ABC transporter ATP-binding protein [Paenibacillus alvei]